MVTENLHINHNVCPFYCLNSALNNIVFINFEKAQYRGKWHLSVKSYRSMLGQIPNSNIAAERNMYALTLDENVFILLEDPVAPSRADVLAVAPPGQELLYLQSPSHYRNTFLTLKPPGALEQLLSQIKARWVSVRQVVGPRKQMSGQQLTIEGHVFAIGTDWLVRVGNVILTGGAVKGMLLEVKLQSFDWRKKIAI